MTPSINAAKKLADILQTTVGYLLGETQQQNLFKDPAMLNRLNEISGFQDEDKNHILYTLDAMIKSVKPITAKSGWLNYCMSFFTRFF